MATVVVGYVPKPEGEAALRSGVEEARLRGASLLVVNSHRHDDGVDVAAIDQALADSGVEHEVRQVEQGLEASEDLLTAATEVAADLIVIGLRRRTPVGKLILGSNAQRILLDAPCPVLAVKAD